MSQKEHAVERAAKIFAIIKQAAVRDEVCPTNAILAERFGCSRGAVENSFSFLVANGMVEIIQASPNRIVEVHSVGKRTAGFLGPKKPAFADLLADGFEVPAACERMGIAKSLGYKYLAEMRDDLGEQAA